MRRLALVALIIQPLALAAAGQAPPVFRTEIGLVVVHATVRNQHREPVTDLASRAFTVYENGTPQTITLFRQGDVPVSLGILLDNSRSMRGQRAAVEAAALAALRSSKPQDETFVMNFADRPAVDVSLTGDVSALEAGVHRADSLGGTALRDAVAAAQEYLGRHARQERKALIVISDGNDNASTIKEDDLEKQTEQQGIAVYVIGLLNRDDPAKARSGQKTLERLAESSGGVAYYPPAPDEASRSIVDVARQVRHVYTIGYAPLAQALDGSYRKLRVVAKGRERLWVKTRPGYRAARKVMR
jgi:Ca-activated chloride channel homolog